MATIPVSGRALPEEGTEDRWPHDALPDYGLGDRRFGIEVEFFGGYERYIADRMKGLGLKTSYDWSDGGWELGEDDAWELRSPILAGSDGARQVSLASRALVLEGADVDDSCGLHVHHEVEDLGKDAITRVLENYHGSQRAIDELIAPYRRSMYEYVYCRPLTGARLVDCAGAVDLADLKAKARGFARFRVVNISCLPYRGTLEFRQLEGTVDAEVILPWVAFGQALIHASARGARLETSDLGDLLTKLAKHGELNEVARESLCRKAA